MTKNYILYYVYICVYIYRVFVKALVKRLIFVCVYIYIYIYISYKLHYRKYIGNSSGEYPSGNQKRFLSTQKIGATLDNDELKMIILRIKSYFKSRELNQGKLLQKDGFCCVVLFFIQKVDTIQLAWSQSAKRDATACFNFTSQKSSNGSFHACKQESATHKKKKDKLQELLLFIIDSLKKIEILMEEVKERQL